MVEPVRVLILGGGFGGVAVAQELEKLVPTLDRPVEVTLISQSNYLLFVPMLPSAAAASVELTHILSPLREMSASHPHPHRDRRVDRHRRRRPSRPPTRAPTARTSCTGTIS